MCVLLLLVKQQLLCLVYFGKALNNMCSKMFSPLYFSYQDSEGLKSLCGANRKICRYNRIALSPLNSPPLPPKAHQTIYGIKKNKLWILKMSLIKLREPSSLFCGYSQCWSCSCSSRYKVGDLLKLFLQCTLKRIRNSDSSYFFGECIPLLDFFPWSCFISGSHTFCPGLCKLQEKSSFDTSHYIILLFMENN